MANRTVSVALRAEIGQYMASMAQASAATKGLGDTSDTAAKKTKGGFDVASKGALLMGGAMVAGLGMAVSKSMEFETAMSAVGAASQATAGDLGKLRAAAMKAGADTQYSATEAAGAITEMAKAGVSAADIMGGGLSGALDLAAAGQLDVASAAEIASVAMQQFNLEGEDLPHVADLLAAGAGKAMGSVEDLGMALNQSGLLAAAAGMSIEETTGALAAFANAGLVGSDAGTSLKTALQMLQAPTEKSSKLMEQLGLDFYDSNGGMISMAEIAGQLESKLGGLTEEQRNAALAQIFGSDAVRAANVLYKEGAAGIQDWTSKVNDSGYAQETAAALTDNLKGDLERLGGAFDTLMISLGSGTQGPLREVVQMLTGVLDVVGGVVGAFSELPGPVQGTIVALAAVAALKGPLGGMFDVLGSGLGGVRGTIGSFNEALGYARANGDGLTTVMKSVGSVAADSVRGGLGSLVGFLGGPVGLAFAGAAVGIGMVTSQMQKAEAQTDTWAQSLLEGSMSAKQFNDEYLKQFGGEEPDWLGHIAEWVGLASGMDEARAKAEELYEALTPMEQKQADVALASNALETAVINFGHGSSEARSAAILLAEAQAVLKGAQDGVKIATDAAKGSIEEATPAVRDFKGEASEAKTAVDGLKAGLDALTGTTVTMFEAESALQEAVEKGTGALEGATGATLNADGSLNAYSESGRKAGEVLLGVRDKGNDLIAMLQNQGASADVVRAKDAELRGSFVRTAEQMGFSRADAERLATQILGIPEERFTRVTADVSQAETAINNFMATRRVVTIGTRTTTARVGSTYDQAGPGYAEGGFTGPGGKYTPAGIVHAGEFVVPKNIVDATGPGYWYRMAGMAEYANGGFVGNTPVSVSADIAGLAAGFQAAAEAAALGSIGGGPAGSGWPALWAKVHAAFPSARKTSDYRPGDPGYHGKGKAVDVAAARPGDIAGMLAINRWAASTMGANLSQLIFTPGTNLLNGKPHSYNAATKADHYDHVHMATYDQGGILRPGYTMAYNGTGKNEYVSKEVGGLSSSLGRGGSSNTDARQFVNNITVPFDADRIAGAISERQRNLEFLHG